MVSLYLIGRKGYKVLVDIYELHGSGIIDCVIVGEDHGIENDYSLEIKAFCNMKNIVIYERCDVFTIKHNSYKFAIGWKWIIKENTNLVVFHDSLLPKYRGFSPLVNMLINKEGYIGVTALYATEGYDEGPIISQKKIKVIYPIKIEIAINRISNLYSLLAMEIIESLLTKRSITSTEQNDIDATYSLWRDEDDYFIDWQKDAEYISRLIDSVSKPFKGAKSVVDGAEVRIFDSVKLPYDVVVENRDNNVGKVIFFKENKPIVVCGTGLLQINEIDRKINFRTRFK